jgi:diguanylate cyclase (GGDEF)-like protein/PAS domain S-box-containing protein
MNIPDDQRSAARRSSDEYLVAPEAILEGLPDAVVATARDERIVFVNGLAEELFGHPRAEIVGQPVQTLWPERERERYTRNMRLYFAVEHPLRFATEVWGLRRDGSEFVGEMSWGIVETAAGPLLLAIGRDISERRAGEARLRALADMGERALAGADPAELAAEAVELLCATLPVAAAQVRLAAGATLATAGPAAELDLRLPLGTGDELCVAPERELTDEELSFAHAVAHTLATALERRRAEARMRHDAVHDPLTGLANRTLLRDRLEVALARSERDGSATGVMFVDLDRFKHINDDFGHAAGDAVLVEVGQRLLTAVRPADTVARFGGDEFVVVCEALDEESALASGGRLQDAVRLPLTVDGVTHHLSASIGIALGASSPDDLLADADAAAYRAKGNGGGRIVLAR